MNRILVTGCAGFIGSHLTETLLRDGFRYMVLTISQMVNCVILESFKNNKNFSFLKCDLNEIQKINKILNDIDVVYHLAALADIVPSIQNPDFYYNSNVNGTFNLIRNCEKKKNKEIYLCCIILLLRNSKKISHL